MRIKIIERWYAGRCIAKITIRAGIDIFQTEQQRMVEATGLKPRLSLGIDAE